MSLILTGFEPEPLVQQSELVVVIAYLTTTRRNLLNVLCVIRYLLGTSRNLLVDPGSSRNHSEQKTDTAGNMIQSSPAITAKKHFPALNMAPIPTGFEPKTLVHQSALVVVIAYLITTRRNLLNVLSVIRYLLGTSRDLLVDPGSSRNHSEQKRWTDNAGNMDQS
jgi:hypothetical protein